MIAAPVVCCRAEGCGRPLRDPVSVSLRMGPVCRERAGIVVVVVGDTPRQRPGRDNRGQAGVDQLVLDLGSEFTRSDDRS